MGVVKETQLLALCVAMALVAVQLGVVMWMALTSSYALFCAAGIYIQFSFCLFVFSSFGARRALWRCEMSGLVILSAASLQWLEIILAQFWCGWAFSILFEAKFKVKRIKIQVGPA